MLQRVHPVKWIFGVIVAVAALFAGGCSGTPSESELGKKLVPSPKDVDLPNVDPAPDVYRVKLETSEGDIIIEVNRDWAPLGADRFHTLVKIGFYDNCRFFRVIEGFMAQCGMNGDPRVMADWDSQTIKDDPVIKSNLPGFVTFAKTGMPHSRSTQFFINFGDNSRLDPDRFAPFGKVVKGMEIAESIYSGYGERPRQDLIKKAGNTYLKKEFPQLDYIIKATIVPVEEKPKEKTGEKKKTNETKK